MMFDFLRHGETELAGAFCGSTDVMLSARGWEQMRHAAKDADWDAIVSSPLQRCAEFARELGGKLGVAVTYNERWRELHFGDWEGQRSTDLPAGALAQFWKDPWQSPPPHGGEALSGFEARVLAAWSELLRDYTGKRVLIVTHGGVIRVLLLHMQGLPRAALLTIDVPHASLHRIQSTLLS